MGIKLPIHNREVLNQFVNFFWTILCFAPVVVFWIKEGISWYFYLDLAIASIPLILPDKILNRFMLSSSRRFYENIGVKFIRKFIQNGDLVNAISQTKNRTIINNATRAGQYLKTIAMYERYHWVCFVFFLLTAIQSFLEGYLKLGVSILLVNVVYNVCTILFQQYNKVRIRKIIR